MLFTAFVALALLSNVLAAPVSEVDLAKRAAQCGQYQSQSSGAYTLFTNGWGWSSGIGSQCSQIDSLSGNSLAWSTTWSWSGTSNQVKSYTNVETGFTKKQISTYTSMPTAWKWVYTGTSLRVNGMLSNLPSYAHANVHQSGLRHLPRLICQRWQPFRSHGVARCIRRRVSAVCERLPIHASRHSNHRRPNIRPGLRIERISQSLQLRCPRRRCYKLLGRLRELFVLV
jgi:hypothetical protein